MRNHDMWIHIFRNSCFSHFLLFWPNGVKGAILSANLSRLSTILCLSASPLRPNRRCTAFNCPRIGKKWGRRRLWLEMSTGSSLALSVLQVQRGEGRGAFSLSRSHSLPFYFLAAAAEA